MLIDAENASARIAEALFTEIATLGEVVAWIFNNEMGGHRVK